MRRNHSKGGVLLDGPAHGERTLTTVLELTRLTTDATEKATALNGPMGQYSG